MDIDIFSTLSKYASQQEENFLTEAFVYLIQKTLEREEDAGIEILSKLLSLKTVFIMDRSSLTLETQYSQEEGRPDIVVRVGDDSIYYVEVKHDSKIGENQLERYHKALIKEDVDHKKLVLLTRSRHSIQETEFTQDKYHHVCWYEISGWMSDIVVEDSVLEFLIDQFLEFLRLKDMSMEKITWEYIKGVPSFHNFANMLGIALAEALPKEKTRRTAGWNWIGYYIGEGTDLWVGFRYKDHMKVVIENNNGNDPTFHEEISLEEAHFFSLNAGEQLECLIKFISESYSKY